MPLTSKFRLADGSILFTDPATIRAIRESSGSGGRQTDVFIDGVVLPFMVASPPVDVLRKHLDADNSTRSQPIRLPIEITDVLEGKPEPMPTFIVPVTGVPVTDIAPVTDVPVTGKPPVTAVIDPGPVEPATPS